MSTGLSFKDIMASRFMCPSLETIWMDAYVLNCVLEKEFPDSLIRFVSAFKNLKFLYFVTNDILSFDCYLTKKNVASIFRHCPSLEVFILNNVYINDVIRESICESRLSKYSLIRSCLRSKRDFKCLHPNELIRKYMNVEDQWHLESILSD